MTLKTWKEEFYPIPANRKMSAEKAIEHSLRKWTGLLKSNLKKHGVDANLDGDIVEHNEYNNLTLNIDGRTCALCQKFYGKDPIVRCGACPLYKTLGNKCDHALNSPFILWMEKQDPKPMIRALQKTLKNYKEGKLK